MNSKVSTYKRRKKGGQRKTREVKEHTRKSKKKNLTKQPLPNAKEMLLLCIHEKKTENYTFRCQPSMRQLLENKGPEWVRNTLFTALERN